MNQKKNKWIKKKESFEEILETNEEVMMNEYKKKYKLQQRWKICSNCIKNKMKKLCDI